MERKRQREIALAVVSIALIGTVLWRVGSLDSSHQASQPAAATPGNATRPAGKSPVTELNLAALETERPEPQESTRNPFTFKPKVVPPPPAPPMPVQMKPSISPEVTGPIEPPPPPPIPLKFIGLMSSGDNGKGGRVAILTDTRGGVFYGREGETVEGRYRILKIGVESIDIAYLDGRGRQTIRQTGQ